MAVEPDVSVRQRVEVTLSQKEVEHALRCHLAHTLVHPDGAVPKPANFSAIHVQIFYNTDTETPDGAVLTYEPEGPK